MPERVKDLATFLREIDLLLRLLQQCQAVLFNVQFRESLGPAIEEARARLSALRASIVSGSLLTTDLTLGLLNASASRLRDGRRKVEAEFRCRKLRCQSTGRRRTLARRFHGARFAATD